MTRAKPDKESTWYRANFEIDSLDLDAVIGKNIRSARTNRGISQGMLGEIIGVSYQQIQKIERGANRITASQLYVISKLLDVDINSFFKKPPEVKTSKVK